ncbi:MAG: arabinogalactan endo-1,4-beta-galactosidase [Microscillaceae bacterium]|nr:arabinogalactan endo-1,4-beta-galactosidase [Microscillaceae bacterium]
MKYILYNLLIISLLTCTPKGTLTQAPLDKRFYRGADLSFLPEMEQAGTQFYQGNTAGSPLQILKKSGMNLVRLRLWHTPAPEHQGHSSLTEVLAFAQRLRAEGVDFLLDFHYSDTWADPGKQFIPQAWQGLSVNTLGDSIFNYTRQVLARLQAQNTLPQMVQIGNETNSGMLWDTGRVGGEYDNNWQNYAWLIKRAIAGVKAVDTQNQVKIMLHFAGYTGAEWYFQNLHNQQVNYDIMGLSYYPLWHGKSFAELQTKLNQLIAQFDKPILIVETAYPWTLEYNDFTHNFVGQADQLMPGYPATPSGQKQFLLDLKKLIQNLDRQKGIGFCYWEPAWVAFKGKQATDGSVWENQTIFDFANRALPGLAVFEQ